MSIRRIVVVSAAALVFLSCQRHPPRIDELQWRLLYRDTGVDRYEELAIFVRVSDSDGPEDLDRITVSAGDSGLIWRFNSDKWVEVTDMREEEDAWIGLPAIIPLEGFSLPEELYTLTLEDRTGESQRITFRPDPNRPRLAEIEWPQARLENGIFLLGKPYEEGTLIIRNDDFTPNQALKVTSGTPISPYNARWWELWIPLPERSSGFRVGPFPLPAVESGELP